MIKEINSLLKRSALGSTGIASSNPQKAGSFRNYSKNILILQ